MYVPEEPRGLHTDVYSTAVLISKMFFGDPPTSQIDLNRMARKHSMPDTLREVLFRAMKQQYSQRPTIAELWHKFRTASRKNLKLVDSDFLKEWVENRVETANTLFLRHPRQSPRELRMMERVQRLLVSLDHLIGLFEVNQLTWLHEALLTSNSGSDLDLEKLQCRPWRSRLNKVIYLYQHKETKCRYVGQVNRQKRAALGERHREHLRDNKIKFEKEFTNEKDWDKIVVMTFNERWEGDLLEILYILLLGSAEQHSERGLNTLVGGSFGTTRIVPL